MLYRMSFLRCSRRSPGFELEVNADWKGGVGRLIELWRNIERESEAQWNDYKEERRKGDPASRFELKEEPKQDVADAFWVSMFRKGRSGERRRLALRRQSTGSKPGFFSPRLRVMNTQILLIPRLMC